MMSSNLVTKSRRQYKFRNPTPRFLIESPKFLYFWISCINLTDMSITGGDVERVSTSRAGSASGSPRNRVKFLCSHGGNILPRPPYCHLKYVGGETRVICVLRDITFPELMKKLTSMSNGEMILKYQLMPEDLDVLVTVRSDEDIRHMIDECDRHEHVGSPRLRAFLFPVNPSVMVNHLGPVDRHSLEQRYLNSINGIVVHPPLPPPPPPVANTYSPLPSNTSYTTFSISSACSSPSTTPETTTTTNSHHNPITSIFNRTNLPNHR